DAALADDGGPRAVLTSQQEVRLELALALDRDGAARLEAVGGGEARVDLGGDVDGAGGAVRLHAARRVHGVAPQVVDELALADHARDDGAGVDADADAERLAARDRGAHLERGGGDGGGVIVAARGDAADHHVRVADRLDLLEPVAVGDLVELGEDL